MNDHLAVLIKNIRAIVLITLGEGIEKIKKQQ